MATRTPPLTPFDSTPTPPPGQIDLLDWMVITNRGTERLTASPLPGVKGTYVSTIMPGDSRYPSNFPNDAFWYVKNVQGNPWDACLFDNNYALCHWITENGDPDYQSGCPGGDCWNYANAYKRFVKGLPLIPRFFTPGSTITIDSPAPNTLVRTNNCEGAGTDLSTALGPVRAITTGPFKMSWGGSIDSGPGTATAGTGTIDNTYGVDTIKNEYYLSGEFHLENWHDLEVTYYVLGFGRVAWFEMKRSTGSGPWTITNSDVNTVKVTGGLPSTVTFPCGPGKSWFQTGGSAPAPPPGGNGVTVGSGSETRQIIPRDMNSELSQTLTFNGTLWDGVSSEKVIRRLQFYYENLGVCTLTATAKVQRYKNGDPSSVYTDSQTSTVTIGTADADGLEYSSFFDFQLAGEIIQVEIAREANAGPASLYMFVPSIEDKGEKVENV